MSTENSRILLTAKEVKNFGLFEYVHPDEEDESQPSWNEDGTINITDDDGITHSYDPETGLTSST